MIEARRLSVLALMAVLVIAACSGSAATATPPSVGSTPGPVSSEAASLPPPTDAPPGATEPPGGGGSGGVCELATASELADAFGVSSVTATVIAGPPDTCSVESDIGDPLVAWSYSTAQASIVYDAFVSDPSSVEVSGVGDRAAFVQNTGLLVQKGSALVVISVQSGDEEIARKLGVILASRM